MGIKNNRGGSQKINPNHIVRASAKNRLSILDANPQMTFQCLF